MTQTPHTPGPWLIREPDNGIYDTDDDIANVVARGPYGLITIAEEVDVADARLIAAAPDLLEAVETAPVLSKYHGQNGFEVERFIADYEAWDAKRRAAIARAAGQEAR